MSGVRGMTRSGFFRRALGYIAAVFGIQLATPRIVSGENGKIILAANLFIGKAPLSGEVVVRVPDSAQVVPLILSDNKSREMMRITSDFRLVFADDVTPREAAKEFAYWVNHHIKPKGGLRP